VAAEVPAPAQGSAKGRFLPPEAQALLPVEADRQVSAWQGQMVDSL